MGDSWLAEAFLLDLAFGFLALFPLAFSAPGTSSFPFFLPDCVATFSWLLLPFELLLGTGFVT